MISIPVSQYPCYAEEIEIDGSLYTFKFYWNFRGQFWAIDIYNSDGNLLIAGIKIVKNYPLASFYPELNIPKGMFFAVDGKLSTGRLTETEFGSTVQLIYVTEADNATV